MQKINDHLYVIDSFSDLEETDFDKIKYTNLLIIVPGMLEDNVSDTQYRTVTEKAILDSKVSDWTTVILHNQSHGVISDALECIVGKVSGDISRYLCNDAPEYPARLLHTLLEDRPSTVRTVIMCHSQGGILTTNAVNCCNEYVRNSLQILFFGAANWLLPNVPEQNMLVFTSKADPVAYLFGRGFCKSTIKLQKSLLHKIPNYMVAMELALEHLFNSTTDEQFNQEIRNV